MNQLKTSFILICIFFLAFVSGCDYTPDKIDYIDGSIVFLNRNPAIYTPSTGKVVKWHWRSEKAAPEFECKIENDTLIISARSITLLNNEKITKSGWYFYKYVPFENILLEPIQEMNDTLVDFYRMNYNQTNQNYLCGRRNNESWGNILFTRDFDSLNFFSKDIIDIHDTNGTTYINLADKGIVFSKLWKSYYLSFNDLSDKKTTLEIPGRIYAISDSGNKLVYQTDIYFDKNNKMLNDLFIYDFIKNTHTKLPIKAKISNICFSPNDKFLAYTEITSNLANDIFLHIYEIKTKKDINTGFELDLSSTLSAWVN